jgi:1,2-diacylglycerol 3-alpha-glucosyltransferase
MRIGMMTDMYKPYVSGVITYISLVKKYLEGTGHQVYVFTFGDENFKDNEENIIRSPGIPVKKDEIHFNFYHHRRARQLIRTMDIVHVHHPFLSGSFTTRFCRPRGIPIAFTHHTRYDLYVKSYLPPLVDSLGESLLNFYMPDFLRKIDAMVVPSLGLKPVVENYGDICPVYYEPHGMELGPFLENRQVKNRSEVGFSQSDIIFIYVGRLGPEKNLPFLLRGFHQLSLQIPQVKLLLVGDGPERENLEDRVQHMGLTDQVHFTGVVAYADLPPYYAMGDVFVTPSITETFGLTVVEAMASGLPVLGIESPGVADNIQPEVTGLISSLVLDDFIAKMNRIATDVELRISMGARGRDESKRFLIENAVERLVRIYQKTIIDRKRNYKRSPGIWLGDFLDRWNI